MSNGSKQTQRSRRVQGQHKTQELETKTIKNADGGDIDVKDVSDRENPDDKPNQAKEKQEAEDQYDAVEGGSFKDIRKAINLSDNPVQQQRLQNKLDKLEFKKGEGSAKVEKLKARGEKKIAKMKYGRKGAEAGMAKEKADKATEEATLAKSKEAERGLTERDLERKWQSDLPTPELGSSYFQSTRPKPSLNVKGLGEEYHKKSKDYRGYEHTSPGGVYENLDLRTEDKAFDIAPFAYKFDKSPLNISLTTPIRQAKRDSKFKDIAQGLNK